MRADALFLVHSWNNKAFWKVHHLAVCGLSGINRFAFTVSAFQSLQLQLYILAQLYLTHTPFCLVAYTAIRNSQGDTFCFPDITPTLHCILRWFLFKGLWDSLQGVLERLAVCSSLNKIIPSNQMSSSGLWILIKIIVDIPEGFFLIFQ